MYINTNLCTYLHLYYAYAFACQPTVKVVLNNVDQKTSQLWPKHGVVAIFVPNLQHIQLCCWGLLWSLEWYA